MVLRFAVKRVGGVLQRCLAVLPCRNNTIKALPKGTYSASFNMAYNTVQKGSQYNESYRVFLEKQGTIVSPWHDIPLFADKTENIFNIVVEIPRWTNAKMEMDTKSRMNPIKQDIKKGKLRFVANVFPHHGYIWNYGAFPQTWEDPSHVDENTHAKGDNDPLDVCEIGQKIHKRGDVVQVKVLGVLAMIDEGETDWKVIAIDVTDPLAHDLHDIDDVEKHMPGLLKATVEWFTLYKVPDGKPKNSFAFNNEAKPKSFALKVISDLHHQWEALVHNKCSHADLVGDSVTLSDSPYKVSADESKAAADSAAEHGPDHSVPAEVSHVVYMKH